MALRTWDFECPNCNRIVYDELVDVDENNNFEPVLCPECHSDMVKKIPLSQWQYSNTFWAGMPSRRVEAIYRYEDGTEKHVNLTHKVKTDTTTGG